MLFILQKNLKIIFSNTNSQGNIEYLISEENDEFVFEGEQVAIDNIDNVQYESLCGHCYFKYKNNK